ncbi:hypothetical protein CIB84_010115 [Bambusicola thoracicus]|uniref:C-type lectin domain-containing protein n=1 Tax=Bambusicola thoracicus TaxID=9083 RepID=A0A2P4SPU9_BAMTH|nr:hypothetical protein CIB84_010115 [Bambusicola thoracicus]
MDVLWIGMNDLSTQMYFEWSDETPVTYTKWLPGEPTHAVNGQEDCVVVAGEDGYWADSDCDRKLGYICRREPLQGVSGTVKTDPACTKGWTRHGSYCYLVGRAPVTFSEAVKTCERIGGYLTTIEDRYEQAYLTSFVGLSSEKCFWIGLSNTEEQEIFKWETGEGVFYTNWNSAMPGTSSHTFVREKNHKKTWFEARDFCREIGGDLAAIISEEEQRVIENLITKKPPSSQLFWIGLQRLDPDGGLSWSDRSPVRTQHSQFLSILTLSLNTLEARTCQPFCQLLFCVAVYEVTEDGWIIKGDKQYFFSTESTSMEKARMFCKNHSGDLAIIGDNNQRIFLWKYVRGNLITFYYIQHIYSAAYACEVQKDILVA